MLLTPGMRPKRPDWLRAPAPAGEGYREVKALVDRLGLYTVCQSAACPNLGECWNQRTATFLLLGGVCTRRCGFCAVSHGLPQPLDPGEPARVAEAVAALALRYAVLTSVTRDDLPDGGAGQFAATVQAIRERVPGCRLEVLIPDFQGSRQALRTLLAAAPDVLNHNLETVPRLYPKVRPGASYERSLELLAQACQTQPPTPAKSGASEVWTRIAESLADARGSEPSHDREGVVTPQSVLAPATPCTKSGLMLGLGESSEEVLAVMGDLRAAGVSLLTLGQYLQPSPAHLAVSRFILPSEFQELARRGHALGFAHVEAGPLVRSSYHAANQRALR